ncbi:hypothetical protein LJ721_004721 [Salmonella enterica]|nr:hypothetical protein [Salmonella enterica]
MAREIIEFDCFGLNFRTKQFSAKFASELIISDEEQQPRDILANTEVLFNGLWIAFNNDKAINDYMKDKANIMPPRDVLRVIVGHVMRLNFEWMKAWRGVKMPARFLSNIEPPESENITSIISTVISHGLATLKECEEYYSLQDIFLMIDALTIKNIGAALANEEAEAEAKRRQR